MEDPFTAPASMSDFYSCTTLKAHPQFINEKSSLHSTYLLSVLILEIYLCIILNTYSGTSDTLILKGPR